MNESIIAFFVAICKRASDSVYGKRIKVFRSQPSIMLPNTCSRSPLLQTKADGSCPSDTELFPDVLNPVGA